MDVSTAIDSDIREITTIIKALEDGDQLKALRLCRERLYYLQEIKEPFDDFDEKQDMDIRLGVEGHVD